MDNHGDSVGGDHVLHRLDTVGLGLGPFFVLDRARRVGHVHCVVDQGSDAGARPAAGDGDLYLGVDLAIGFGPGQSQVDHRVRALVLDGGLSAGNSRTHLAALSTASRQADHHHQSHDRSTVHTSPSDHLSF